MSGVNLIPPDLLARREARRLQRLWGLRLAATLLLLGLFYFGLSRLATGQRAEVDRLAERYLALTERLTSAEERIRERNELAERRSAIGFIREEQTADDLIEALGAALTPETCLTTLALTRCSAAVEPAQPERGAQPCRSQLALRGLAPTHQQVGEVLRRLGHQPVFAEVKLLSVSNPVEPVRGGGVEFEMLCLLAEEAAHD